MKQNQIEMLGQGSAGADRAHQKGQQQGRQAEGRSREPAEGSSDMMWPEGLGSTEQSRGLWDVNTYDYRHINEAS